MPGRPDTCHRCGANVAATYFAQIPGIGTLCVPCHHEVFPRIEDDEPMPTLTLPTEEQSRNSLYAELGAELGELVTAKQKQYGDSAGKSGAILRTLYPDGLAAHQYDDALLVVRVLDKLSRIAQRGPDGKDLGGESPWKDLAGYGLLGWQRDEGR